MFQSVQFSSFQSLSCVWLLQPHESQHSRPPCPSQTPGVYSNSSIESVMPSSHLILCHPLLLLPPISPSIRVFPNESTLLMRWPKYCSKEQISTMQNCNYCCTKLISLVKGRWLNRGRNASTFAHPHAQLIIVILHFTETTKTVGQEFSYCPPETPSSPVSASITVEEVSLGTMVFSNYGFYISPCVPAHGLFRTLFSAPSSIPPSSPGLCLGSDLVNKSSLTPHPS